VTAERDVAGLVANQPLIADFDAQRVEEEQGIHRLERSVLPIRDGINPKGLV
jgi:hypothetical protein